MHTYTHNFGATKYLAIYPLWLLHSSFGALSVHNTYKFIGFIENFIIYDFNNIITLYIWEDRPEKLFVCHELCKAWPDPRQSLD